MYNVHYAIKSNVNTSQLWRSFIGIIPATIFGYGARKRSLSYGFGECLKSNWRPERQ